MMPFDYLVPSTLAEASAALTDCDGTARMLAGGTDLTVGLRHGHLTANIVIDLKRVAELKTDITPDTGKLRVTAGTTMTQLHAYLAEHRLFPSLQDAAAVVGSVQIRNRATLAGNICNASPAADTVPVLAALGCDVEIYGPNGTRTRPIADFIEGNRQIDLGRGEIVTAVHITLPQSELGCAFDRITRRRGVDLATTNMCCTLSATGDVVFAFGAVSPRPLVIRDATGTLGDPTATQADRADAIAQMAAHARPISDVRADADYRAAMLCVMAERSLKTAQARLSGGMQHG